MKTVFLTIAASILISSYLAGQNTGGDFRGFKWGDSFAKVQNDEKAKFVKIDKDDLLMYQDEVAGSDFDVIYEFNDNNKLVNGAYVFSKKYVNPQLYLQDYNKFKEILSSKYGKPSQESEVWGSNVVRSDKGNYGQAVSDGELTLISTWSTDRTVIKITLISINKVPSLQIYYTASSLNELENKDDLKRALQKL
jgi:hypothetical protein